MTSQEGTPSGLVTLGLFKKIEMLSLAMTVVMKLELILKHFKTALKDFKVFTGLGLYHLTTSTGEWVACLKLEIRLSQPQLKLKLS